MTEEARNNNEDIFTPTHKIGVIKDKYIIANTQKRFREFSDFTNNLFCVLSRFEKDAAIEKEDKKVIKKNEDTEKTTKQEDAKITEQEESAEIVELKIRHREREAFKNSIKDIESLFNHREVLSETENLGGLQAILHNLNERRSPLFTYVKNLPPKLNKKHIWQLFTLWNVYKNTKESIIFCYQMEQGVETIKKQTQKRQEQSANDRQKYKELIESATTKSSMNRFNDDPCDRAPTQQELDMDELHQNYISICKEKFIRTKDGEFAHISSARTGIDKLKEAWKYNKNYSPEDIKKRPEKDNMGTQDEKKTKKDAKDERRKNKEKRKNGKK